MNLLPSLPHAEKAPFPSPTQPGGLVPGRKSQVGDVRACESHGPESAGRGGGSWSGRGQAGVSPKSGWRLSGSAQGRPAAGMASLLQTATRSVPYSPDCRLRVEGLEEGGGGEGEGKKPRSQAHSSVSGQPPSPIPNLFTTSPQLSKLGVAPQTLSGPGSRGHLPAVLVLRPGHFRSEQTPPASPARLGGYRSRGPGGRRGRRSRPLGGRSTRHQGQVPTPPRDPLIPTSPGPKGVSPASRRRRHRYPPPPETCRPGGARRQARCRAFSSERPCRQPGHPNRLPHTRDTRLAADGPPGPSAPLDAPSAAAGPRAEDARRSPGAAIVTRAFRRRPPAAAPPRATLLPCLPPGPARRRGLQASTAGTGAHELTALRPRLPESHVRPASPPQPGRSCPPRLRPPAAVACRHLHPTLPFAFPSE